MSFPAYASIEEPLLCYIYLHGGDRHEIESDTSYRPLARFFALSPSELQETVANDDPDLKWNNMIRWTRNALKKRGLLANSPRGIWRLSDLGVFTAQKIAHKYTSLK